jgi:hypothetical protein
MIAGCGWKWTSANGIIIGDQSYTYEMTDTTLCRYIYNTGKKYRDKYTRK